MIQSLRQMACDLDQIVRAVVVEQLTSAEATDWLRAAAAVERRAAVVKTLVAKRATESGTWATSGHRSPESWVGEQTGAGYGSASATLRASDKLGELPGLNEAARGGELSEEQLKEIGDAATPENEADLLNESRKGNADQLRKKCKREKAKARSNDDERARHDKAHRERFFRSWTDNDGAWRFEGKTTAIDGARFEAALGAVADQIFKQAWKDGRRETAAAYKLDALFRLVTAASSAVDEASSKRRAVNTEVVIRVDATRLARGDGLCETTATGPIPVDAVIGAILAGAFVKVVLHNGVDVVKVSHVGRHVPAEVKTAIKERDGHACVRCGGTRRLEVHHYRVPYARGGVAAYWNLVTLCSYCHDLVTNDGFELRGKPGAWEWVVPAGRAPP